MGWYCAERDGWDIGWQCPHCYGQINEFDQVAPTPEVTEYVWDGSGEAFKAIRDALGHGQGVLEVWLGDNEYEPAIEITDRHTLNLIGVVVHQGRIQPTPGGLAPFVILPPEVKS